jgi:biopolymer transport protein ExbB
LEPKELALHRLIHLVAVALLLATAHPCAAVAQSGATESGGNPNPAASATSDAPQSFLEIVHAGGLVGYIIMLLSVVAVALAIEHAMTIRAKTLLPPGLAEKVRELVKASQFAQAEQACKLHPSMLGAVLQAGLNEIDGGWSGIEKAMEDTLADQSARLFRKIEYLSVIGNIAPMLGLLGTVIGMVMAFREVAMTQGAARAADLAEGIYLALVTTVQGLVVAIPCLSVFAVFRNRVDQMVAEVSYAAQHALTPLKRAKRRKLPSALPPGAAAPGLTVPPPRERKP